MTLDDKIRERKAREREEKSAANVRRSIAQRYQTELLSLCKKTLAGYGFSVSRYKHVSNAIRIKGPSYNEMVITIQVGGRNNEPNFTILTGGGQYGHSAYKSHKPNPHSIKSKEYLICLLEHWIEDEGLPRFRLSNPVVWWIVLSVVVGYFFLL